MSHLTNTSSVQERLLDMVGDGAIIVDRAGTIIWANLATRELLGVVDEVRGTSLSAWFAAGPSLDRLLAERGSRNGRPNSMVVSAKNNGAELLVSIHPRSEHGGFSVVVRPLKNAVSSFDRAISFATRDAVTQLLNRDAFHERLARAI